MIEYLKIKQDVRRVWNCYWRKMDRISLFLSAAITSRNKYVPRTFLYPRVVCIRCIVSTHNSISQLSVFVKVDTKLIEYNFLYDKGLRGGKKRIFLFNIFNSF